MGFLTDLGAVVAPEWTLRRVAARAQLERLYDAAKTHHQHLRPTDTKRSADSNMDHATDKVTAWARHLDQNHDIVSGLFDQLANRVCQMTIEPMVRSRGGELNTVVNDQLSDLFKRWRDTADSSGTLGWSDLVHHIARSWYRDGEVFINHRFGEGEILPYSLEALEQEFLPFTLTQGNTPAIIHGVEKSDAGRPTAYYFYKSHPGNQDTLTRFAAPTLQDLTRVPADQVSHVKRVSRLHQTRGISVLHSVAHRLDSLNDYEQSEQIAARIAASLSLFVQTTPQWGATQAVNATSGELPFEMDAGQIHRLGPGESIMSPDSNRPNPGLMDFRRGQLRAVASGTGARYSTLARDYSDGSYSSQRQELVEGRTFEKKDLDSFAAQFWRPVWSRFVRAAEMSGRIASSAINPETIFDMDVSGLSIPWIDMKKEVEADTAAVAAGFKSRQQVIREHGGSLREIDRERAQDKQPAANPLEAVENDDPANTNDDIATA